MKNEIMVPAIAWFLLTTICIIMILAGLRAGLKRTKLEKSKQNRIFFITATCILAWSALLLMLSYKGFFANFNSFPPRPVLALLIPLPLVLLIAFSNAGTQILKAIPAHWLVFMQSFRIAVELLILMAFVKDQLPVQMTFEGRNFDILSGVLAIPVGYILAKGKTYAPKLAIAFNIVSLLLLINILVIAVLSMPTPIRFFMNEPANTLVAQFPFILLPGVLVPIAYTISIFSLRQLLALESNRQQHIRAIS
jgi:hypothetical protein